MQRSPSSLDVPGRFIIWQLAAGTSFLLFEGPYEYWMFEEANR